MMVDPKDLDLYNLLMDIYNDNPNVVKHVHVYPDEVVALLREVEALRQENKALRQFTANHRVILEENMSLRDKLRWFEKNHL